VSLLYLHCARNHPTDSSVEWCFSDFDVMSHAPETAEYWKDWGVWNFAEALMTKGREFRKHFAHPKYRRVNGKPVVYRGNADFLLYYEQRFDIEPSDVLSLQEDGAGEEIYWVATNTPPTFCRQLKQWGFEAYTHYLIYPNENTWADAMVTYRNSWNEGIEIARQTGLKFWPSTTSGFDSRAWYDHPSRFMPTPSQYEAHIREATEFSRRNFVYTDGQVVHEAWNERGENPDPLEPSLLTGDAKLQAFKRGAA
jgi:hypothetical protein